MHHSLWNWRPFKKGLSPMQLILYGYRAIIRELSRNRYWFKLIQPKKINNEWLGIDPKLCEATPITTYEMRINGHKWTSAYLQLHEAIRHKHLQVMYNVKLNNCLS